MPNINDYHYVGGRYHHMMLP